MAAGLGFKTFTTGEVLTAADTNGYLMQGILVFASAAARDAAITSPQEGQACYLKDTDQVLSYSGSTWVAVGGGSPLTTKGDLFTFSTVNARLAVGTNGQVLTADSSEATGLKFATPAGGGKVLQVINATTDVEVANSTTTYADSGLDATITPSSATSKVLILVTQNGVYKNNANNGVKLRLNRGVTEILQFESNAAYTASNAEAQIGTVGTNYLDSPNTTSATTYKTQFARTAATGASFLQLDGGVGTQSTSTITLLEIGA